MLNILLVDDEPLALSRLQRLITKISDCEVVGTASNGAEALAKYTSLKPDVLLLDINMPEIDGLEVAAALKQMNPSPAIIFCTAYDQHALQAFNEQALDYLVKPVRQARLCEALDKARQYLGLQAGENSQRQYIRSRVGEKIILVSLLDILFCRAEDKYTIIYHTAGEALIDESLKTLEKEFANEFIRIHRNTLVLRERIRGLQRDGKGQHYVLLEGTEQQPLISRRNYAHVRTLLANS